LSKKFYNKQQITTTNPLTMENSKNYSEVARDEERKFNSQMLKEFKNFKSNNQVSNTQVLNQTQELTEEQNEEQIPLGDKLIYAFCFITAIYFIGRFIAGIIFNV